MKRLIKKAIKNLQTAKDVYEFFNKDNNIVTTFLSLYMEKCSSFLINIRRFTNNSCILPQNFSNKDANTIINELINNHIFDLTNENMYLINKSILPLTCIHYNIKIQNIQFKLTNDEFNILIQKYSNIQVLYKFLKRQFNQYNKNIITNSISDIAELPYTKIKVGESINLNELFYKSYHKLTVTPVVYINGNFIEGNNTLYIENITQDNEAVRQYHYQLIEKYCHNENLHTKDIVKKPMEFWESVDIDSLCGIGEQKYSDIQVGEGVIYQDICLIVFIPHNMFVSEVTAAYKQYHSTELYTQNDSSTFATKLAKKHISFTKLG